MSGGSAVDFLDSTRDEAGGRGWRGLGNEQDEPEGKGPEDEHRSLKEAMGRWRE